MLIFSWQHRHFHSGIDIGAYVDVFGDLGQNFQRKFNRAALSGVQGHVVSTLDERAGHEHEKH
jgi:hypothetical protein